MEIPNARILDDGVVRFSGAVASPYRWINAGMGILPGLEFSARLTAITNISALTPEYGSNKDKAFDIKYQLFPESKELPAVAIGFNDFHGTGLFTSEYIVVSRQVYPFDLTFGIGSKRFSGGQAKFFTDRYSLFGGFEFELSDRFMFMAEYNPIKYEDDVRSARGVPKGAKAPVNVGLRTRIIKGIDLGISFQRGDTLGLSLSIGSLLGDQVLPQAPDPAPLLPVDRRPFDERGKSEVIQSIYGAVNKAGFEDVTVYTDGMNIICEFQNKKYFSNQKAVDRVLRHMLFHSPKDTRLLTAVVKKGRFPILKISVKPDHMDKYILGDIPEETFVNKLLKVEIANDIAETDAGSYLKVSDKKGLNFEWEIGPDLDIYWNDPSGFYKFSAGIAPYITMDLWKGASAYARFTVPVYSNITSPSTENLPHDVVRSDIARYKKDNYTFDRLIINQIIRLSDRWFSRISLGYFDIMYAGIGGESLYFIGDGRAAFGIEGDWVKKRVPKTLFELMDVDRYTLLGSAYYYYPGLDITFKAQYGRFLAGDVGWKIGISRKYKTGAVLGMFVTFTDTDNINQPDFNDGYNHKGVSLSIPLRMFYAKDSTKSLNYGISPWTRDVGQTVSHWKELYSIAGDLMPVKFKNESDEIKN
ncbi:MAG: YjbH domain-containing protein [Deltaproteobacteria bacterium]|nr:YjbH domain-containing protein [Deltaproteobacteria bacterium]